MTSNVFQYTQFGKNSIEIESYEGEEEHLFIPSEIDGYKVTSIGAKAFYNFNSLKSVILPEGVTNIGKGAFIRCSSLKDIYIPDSVTSIGDSAFLSCNSLQKIKLPANLENIENNVFGFCNNLKNVEIPGSVMFIEAGAFMNCRSLNSIIIPEGVMIIETGAFYECSSLQSVKLPESLGIIYDYAFGFCGSLENINIPEEITYIGSNAFEGCYKLQNSNEIRLDNINMEDFYDKEKVKAIKEQFPKGTRIQLNAMDDPFSPIFPGTKGTVKMVDGIGNIHIDWDNGRRLAVVPGVDLFTKINEQKLQNQKTTLTQSQGFEMSM